MLVLSRRVGESFVIGDKIVVTVVRIAGGGVRLGIEAPSDFIVVRKELAGATAEMPVSVPSTTRPDERRLS
jgi:carbon storage regulator